jgi:L-Lysine epsilon oxidase N-terminal/L-lysine epsilon oxidase C-terminal domain
MRRVYQIHPAIGIARLGNSTTEHVIGPEVPGAAAQAQGPFRDPQNAIKRQGVRFRIYEFEHDDSGRLAAVREITAAEAQIEWRVHLVNAKAAADKFPSFAGRPETPRNRDIADRSRLVIDAGAQRISGGGQRIELAGAFLETAVPLGTLLTDEAGRLIVLGGFGTSRSVPPGEPLGPPTGDFANNDLWCDDIADGPVSATLRFGREPPVEPLPARVIVAPPDFAPAIGNVTTLYDVVFEVATEFDPTLAVREPLSFTRHIYPILAHAATLAWVSPIASAGHGKGAGGDFLHPQVLASLADNRAAAAAARADVFRRLRSPFGESGPLGTMPRLNAGLDPDRPDQGRVPPTLTAHQYNLMRDWKDGLFAADWTGAPPAPPPFAEIPPPDQPAALDVAALETSVGAPFFPGIECGFPIAQRATYEAPFRIARTLPPGALTARMAVPWQADFLDCGTLWWPGQRPNSVRRDGEWQDWTPASFGYVDMVDNWARLGFIVRRGDEYVEQERLLDTPIG